MKNLFIFFNGIFYLLILSLWISIPDEFTLNISVTIFTLTFTMILIFYSKDQLSYFYKSSFFKNLVSNVFSIILIFFILCLVNYFAFKNPFSIDVSSNKQNSLTEQSVKISKIFKEPVKVLIFSRKVQAMQLKLLIELYRLENNKITYEVIDPIVRPDLVKHYDIQKDGTVVLKHKDKKEKIDYISELNITNALLRLSRKKSSKIYYITGHGEKKLNLKQSGGLSFLKDAIVNSNFKIEEIDLRKINRIPQDANGVIIWGAISSFTEREILTLEHYKKQGGRFLVAFDVNFNKELPRRVIKMFSSWGVDIKNYVVVDHKSHFSGTNGLGPIVFKYSQTSPITRSMKEGVFFPVSTALFPKKVENVRFVSLAQSSPLPGSWADSAPRDVAKKHGMRFSPEEDISGPITLIASLEPKKVEKNQKKWKMVVFPNSTFVTNLYSRFSNQFRIVLNSLYWLEDYSEIISFNSPVLVDEPVFISSQQKGLIFYFSVIVLPLIILCMLILVYRRQRNL